VNLDEGPAPTGTRAGQPRIVGVHNQDWNQIEISPFVRAQGILEYMLVGIVWIDGSLAITTREIQTGVPVSAAM